MYNIFMFERPDNVKIESPQSFSQNIVRQEKYLELLQKKAEPYTPKELDFSDIYSPEEIQKDMELIQEIKERFKQNETPEGARFKRISDVFEGVVAEQAEQNAWFGKNVTFYHTSEYDDLVNGVDGVAEFYEEDRETSQHTALSFDVVFSADAQRIFDKLERTRKMIDNGELTEVKYFEDEEGNRKTIKAPRIVLGSRLSSAENLIDMWGKKSPDKNRRLAEHPMQIKLLLESYMQLRHFSEYAQEQDKNDIALEYAKLSNKIVEILNTEKKELMDKYFYEVSDDIVFETIKTYCDKVEI